MNELKSVVSKPSEPTIEEVQELFKEWRKTKSWRDSIPEELWQAAAELVKKYPLNQVSKALRLDYTDLKKHIASAEANNTASPSFVELDFSKPLTDIESTVEMENNGGRLKICVKGQAVDVIGLARVFLAGGK